jgi:FkbM family methyltransferase
LYPADSLIGRFLEAGKKLDRVLRTIEEELILEEEPVICEVGSNIGASLLQILAAKPRAYILAFEPSRRFRPFLERNLELAGADRVKVYSYLVGRRGGVKRLYNNASTASAVSESYDDHEPRGSQLSRVTTLDRVFRNSKVDFIKVDTDGFEFEVLRGAESTLKRCRPVLHFEMATYLVSEPVTNLAWLQKMGYERLLCLSPTGAPLGATDDPEQVIALANESGYCDIVICFAGSPAEVLLEHLEL